MRRTTLVLAAALTLGAALAPGGALAQTPASTSTTVSTTSTTAPPPATTVPPMSTTTVPPATTVAPTTTTTAAPTSTTSAAPAPTPPEGGTLAPKVRGVGDSVFLSAQAKVVERLRPEYRPRFRSVLGATIADMTPTAREMASNEPAAMVLGLGNPDMALVDEPYPPDVYADAERILNRTATVPCVVWVNLKQRGVNGYYNQQWEAAASAFNQWLAGAASAGGGLHYQNLHILDWNAATVGHPGWFKADGLHLNTTGQIAYANKIDRYVNRVCPPS